MLVHIKTSKLILNRNVFENSLTVVSKKTQQNGLAEIYHEVVLQKRKQTSENPQRE